MKIITTLFLLAFCMSTQAIVTIENLPINDTDLGHKSNLSVDISGSSGNSDTADAQLGADWVFKTEHHINYVLLAYEYGEANSQANTNNTLLHARHIRKQTTLIDIEYFAQIEQNEFARLNNRSLIGSGARFTLPTFGFLGIGALYFDERLDSSLSTNDELNDDGVRLNAYLSHESQYDDRTLLTAQIYAQPKLEEFDDFRLLFNAALEFAITSKLSIRIGLRSTHDSKPPTNVEKTNLAYTSGFEYSF